MESQTPFLSDGGESPESIITDTHQFPSSSHEETNYPSSKPDTIVLALCAPTAIGQNPHARSIISHPRHIKKESRRPPSSAAFCVFKFADLSGCCDCAFSEKLRRLKLSGCAVLSKGVLVVEGKIGSIRGFSKFVRLCDTRARVAWQGKISRPSFGKFSILRHSSSEFAVCKFFSDHGASCYWDLIA